MSDPGGGGDARVPRSLVVLGGWLLLFLATPGCVSREGSWLVAVLGVALWGLGSSCPLGERPKRALLAEWAANAVGMASLMWWVVWVVPFGVLYIGVAMGLYQTLGGGLVRRLAGRWPAGVAVALGWLGAETLRTVLAPPLGLGWFQLGHHLHAEELLVGGARVVGLEGLTLALAALGGLGTELWRARGLRGVSGGTFALALGASGLLLVGSLATSPPETEDGPRVLVVQPSFTQDEKQLGGWQELHAELVRRSVVAARRDAERGTPPDLVVWGETLLFDVADASVAPALAAGRTVPPWLDFLDPQTERALAAREDALVRRDLLEELPPGTSFLAGAVVYDDLGERIGRRNAIVLYDPGGTRGRTASKRFLVPGAETACGLERFDWVRDLAFESMGYVPDFAPAEETAVIGFATRDGRAFRVAASVCFDNAFLGAFVEPVAAGPVDFHVVASNEAWYRDAFEMDQMLAFSRVAAVASGRAIVRATNSGVSCVLGPDGKELARVHAGPLDRSIPGEISVSVPTPRREPESDSAPKTAYTTLRTPIRLLALFAPLALCLVRRRAAPHRGNHPARTG